MTWQPLTHSDQTDMPVSHEPLAFELDAADQAVAAAARHYLKQRAKQAQESKEQPR